MHLHSTRRQRKITRCASALSLFIWVSFLSSSTSSGWQLKSERPRKGQPVAWHVAKSSSFLICRTRLKSKYTGLRWGSLFKFVRSRSRPESLLPTRSVSSVGSLASPRCANPAPRGEPRSVLCLSFRCERDRYSILYESLPTSFSSRLVSSDFHRGSAVPSIQRSNTLVVCSFIWIEMSPRNFCALPFEAGFITDTDRDTSSEPSAAFDIQ